MLIKVVQNGIESDWFQLTKKAHRELIKKKPEAAIVHIEDVYPDSPDTGRVILLHPEETTKQASIPSVHLRRLQIPDILYPIQSQQLNRHKSPCHCS